MVNKNLTLLIAILMLVLSCKTDIDISGEWENIPVVYSIIDPADTIHYIRINRVFSGNESGFSMAMQPDSLIYSDTLDVKIRITDSNNNEIKTVTFKRTELDKDSVNNSGEEVFSTKKHHVYYSKESMPYDNGITYHLFIKLPDGKTITSTCHPLVGLIQTNPGIGEKYTIRPGRMFGPSFKLPKHSGGLKLNLFFHYYEFDSSTNYVRKTIMFPVRMQRQKESVETSMGIQSNEIFDRIKMELTPPEQGVKRFVGKVDYQYIIADNNYAEQLWKRVGGFNYETQPISNIIGGYGLFACRSNIILRGYKPTDNTKCYFATNPELLYLGFQKAIFYATYNIDSLP